MEMLRSAGKQLFSKYLLLTNTITTGSLLCLGDAITQHIERRDQPHTEKKQFNYGRSGRMFCMGFVLGPFNHCWYKVLDRYLPGATAVLACKKILADQMVAAPFFCSSFFMGMSLLEGKTVNEGIEEVKDKFLTVYLIDWCVWPPAQFINFFYLPTKFRVVYVSTITLFWNMLVSYLKHKDNATSVNVISEQMDTAEDNKTS